MATITIAYEVSEANIKKIEELVERESINNVNLNGEKFAFERGDFTHIDKDDEDYVALLYKINEIILGY